MDTQNRIQFQMQGHRLDAVWFSDIGDRELQEDAVNVSCHHDTLAATICDGMGGYQGGEAASMVALEFLHDAFMNGDAVDASFYSELLDEMDARVYFLKDETGQRLNAGTTIVSVLIHGDHLNWFSVGDSRIYIIRGGEMIQATHDHNYCESLREMLRNGRITQEQFDNERERHAALTSYIGMGGVKLYDISTAPFILKDGDMLLLASDGLYNAIPPELLRSSFGADAEETAQCLIGRFKAAQIPSKDNTTFIIITYHQEEQK